MSKQLFENTLPRVKKVKIQTCAEPGAGMRVARSALQQTARAVRQIHTTPPCRLDKDTAMELLRESK